MKWLLIFLCFSCIAEAEHTTRKINWEVVESSLDATPEIYRPFLVKASTPLHPLTVKRIHGSSIHVGDDKDSKILFRKSDFDLKSILKKLSEKNLASFYSKEFGIPNSFSGELIFNWTCKEWDFATSNIDNSIYLLRITCFFAPPAGETDQEERLEAYIVRRLKI